MGFEWRLISAQSISDSARQQLLADFAQSEGVYLVNHSFNSEEATGNYSLTDAAHRRQEWPEDFTLSVTAQQVYLCIHSATGTQREYITKRLNNCLSQAGIAAELAEL